MATKTDIANMALALLGTNPVTDIGDDTPAGFQSRVFFHSTVDRVVRNHPWKSTLKRVALTATTTPVFGYDYAYILPADPYCLKVWEMQEPEYRFKVENRLLLTDETTAKILYSFRPTIYGSLDPDLIAVIYYELAIQMCMALTRDRNLKKELIEDLTMRIEKDAKFNGAIEELQEEKSDEPSTWIQERNTVG